MLPMNSCKGQWGAIMYWHYLTNYKLWVTYELRKSFEHTVMIQFYLSHEVVKEYYHFLGRMTQLRKKDKRDSLVDRCVGEVQRFNVFEENADYSLANPYHKADASILKWSDKLRARLTCRIANNLT